MSDTAIRDEIDRRMARRFGHTPEFRFGFIRGARCTLKGRAQLRRPRVVARWTEAYAAGFSVGQHRAQARRAS